jgi:hypothetical protein
MGFGKIIFVFALFLSICINGFGQQANQVEAELARYKAALLNKLSPKEKTWYQRMERASFAQLELTRKSPELIEPGETTQPLKLGDKLYVYLSTTNTETEKVVFDADQLYYVRPDLQKDGETIPYQAEVKKAASNLEFECSLFIKRQVIVEGNHRLTEYIDLAYWYGSLSPGQYQLKVKRRYVWGGNWVESPPLVFEIVPAP